MFQKPCEGRPGEVRVSQKRRVYGMGGRQFHGFYHIPPCQYDISEENMILDLFRQLCRGCVEDGR